MIWKNTTNEKHARGILAPPQLLFPLIKKWKSIRKSENPAENQTLLPNFLPSEFIILTVFINSLKGYNFIESHIRK